MCIICVELSKNKLTPREARRNLGEMIHVIDEEHRLEVLRNIWKAEDEEDQKNDLRNGVPLSEGEEWHHDDWAIGSD